MTADDDAADITSQVCQSVSSHKQRVCARVELALSSLCMRVRCGARVLAKSSCCLCVLSRHEQLSKLARFLGSAC